MNREIKFRAYDKEYERMTYFDDEDYLYHCPFILRLEQVFKKDSNYDDYENFEYKDVTDKIELMQYTGLHDENGKEIYEGDIIEWTTLSGKKYRFSVEYSNKYAQYIITNTGDVENEAEPLGDYENIEVIGNVFENGDILNDSKNTEKN